jgi:sacsin
MRALVCTQLGSPVEPLRATSQPGKGPLELHSNYTLPELRPGFVRIKVVAASLNFADALQLQGLYQDRPKLPFVPGGEVC